MALSRTAVEIGVVGAVGEFLIFQHCVPPVSDVRACQPNDPEIEKSERTGLIAGTIFLAFLTAFSPGKLETFAIAGSALAAMDWIHKHANAVHPATGKISGGPDMAEQSLYSVPDYEQAEGTG